jgi:phosphinothricin acetyltransferase
MTPDASPPRARPAHLTDAAAIAGIYNQGIEDRVATFETEPRTPEQIARWFDADRPIVVATDADGTVIAFASTSAYRDRPCYAGIAEFSVYVRRDWRSRGAGQVALAALIDAAGAAGLWKLVSRVFPENAASRALLRRMGFREVGVYHRHGHLNGVWRDCVIVERLLGGDDPATATKD